MYNKYYMTTCLCPIYLSIMPLLQKNTIDFLTQFNEIGVFITVAMIIRGNYHAIMGPFISK